MNKAVRKRLNACFFSTLKVKLVRDHTHYSLPQIILWYFIRSCLKRETQGISSSKVLNIDRGEWIMTECQVPQFHQRICFSPGSFAIWYVVFFFQHTQSLLWFLTLVTNKCQQALAGGENIPHNEFPLSSRIMEVNAWTLPHHELQKTSWAGFFLCKSPTEHLIQSEVSLEDSSNRAVSESQTRCFIDRAHLQ